MSRASPAAAILVAGSNKGSANQVPFDQVCREAGRAIATRGYRLIIGSIASRTADRHVFEGYFEADGPSVALICPEAETYLSEAQKLADHKTEVTIEQPPQPVWRMRQVRRADGAWFIGGGKGTREIFELCQLRARPFVASPDVPGESMQILAELQRMLEAAPRRFDAGLETIELLEQLLEQPMIPAIRSELLEPHVNEVLQSAAERNAIDAIEALSIAAHHTGSSSAYRKLRELLGTSAPKPPPGQGPAKALELKAPFGESLRIARATVQGRAQIWGRTLLTAALFDPDAKAPWLDNRIEEIREAWTKFLEAEERDYWQRWKESLKEYKERLNSPRPSDQWTQPIVFEKGPSQIARALAGFTGDMVPASLQPKDDRLDLTSEVNALCAVIAAREVQPPLSIALFGDWGVGKTFFMRQMKSRIEALAKEATKVEQLRAAQEQKNLIEPAYWPDIAQVEFNAWHFMDNNLWASLVSRLFEALVEHVQGSKEPTADILERLSLVNRQSQALKAQGEEVQKEIDRLKEDQKELESDLKSKEDKLEAIDLACAFPEALLDQLIAHKEVKSHLIDAGILSADKDPREELDKLKRGEVLQALRRAPGPRKTALLLCLLVLVIGGRPRVRAPEVDFGLDGPGSGDRVHCWGADVMVKKGQDRGSPRGERFRTSGAKC